MTSAALLFEHNGDVQQVGLIKLSDVPKEHEDLIKGKVGRPLGFYYLPYSEGLAHYVERDFVITGSVEAISERELSMNTAQWLSDRLNQVRRNLVGDLICDPVLDKIYDKVRGFTTFRMFMLTYTIKNQFELANLLNHPLVTTRFR